MFIANCTIMKPIVMSSVELRIHVIWDTTPVPLLVKRSVYLAGDQLGTVLNQWWKCALLQT